jgi:plasmid replication initiation protein
MSKKNNAMIEYSKDFATSINDYSAYELDLVLSLAYTARKNIEDHKSVPLDKNLILTLPAVTIKRMLQGNVSTTRLKDSLKNVFNTNIFLREDNFTKVKHIFETLCFNDDLTEILFELKKEYIHLFFNLTGNFTQHELLEFTSLKGKYAKKMYQIVMSYRDLKTKEYPADFFRKIMGVPEAYRWVDIESKMMNTIREEFKKTNIQDLKLERIREGRTIGKIILTWDIKEPEIIKTESKKKPKKEVKKEEVEEVKFVEPAELTPEEEERAIKKMLADGMDKNYIELMRKNSKTMFINMARELLKGVE